MKKNQQNILLFSFFIITLLLLGKHSLFPDTGLSQATNSNITKHNNRLFQQVMTLDLGKVDVKDYQRMGFTKGFVKFSVNGKYLAVGTESNKVFLLDTRGRILWQRDLGVGRLTALEFSPDSKYIYVGEMSPDGNLYCFEVSDGKENWRRASSTDIGVNIKIKSYPGVMRIVCDTNGAVYAVSQRRYRGADGLSQYNSKILSLSPAGTERWVFPHQGAMDAWVNWVSVDNQGTSLVFGTANFETRKQHEYAKNLYCLDGSNGSLAWEKKINPVHPYNRTIMRGSPNISADGNYLAAMTSDGRGFLYNSRGQKQWEYVLSLPKQVNGVYLNAVGRDAYVIGETVVFASINTYNNANWQLPTPVEHPGSNSVFIFDLAGNLTGKWQSGGSVEELTYNKKMLVLAIGRNTKTKDHSIHGLAVLSLPKANLIERIPTEGPCMAVDISMDGSQLAGIEAPLKLDNGTIIGRYQLILFAKKTPRGEYDD